MKHIPCHLLELWNLYGINTDEVRINSVMIPLLEQERKCQVDSDT